VTAGMLADTQPLLAPLACAGIGAVTALGLWLAARRGGPMATPMRFLAAVAGAWLAVCLAYAINRPAMSFTAYLINSTLATEIIAAIGAAFYVGCLLRPRRAGASGGSRRGRAPVATVLRPSGRRDADGVGVRACSLSAARHAGR
jgi:hypothetical protein